MFWKNKGKPRTVRFFLPSLHTSVPTLLQAGHAQRPLLVLLLCLWNSIKERCSIRGKRLSPSHPGNHKGYHVSDEFPELRTQRYRLFHTHANFLREKLKDWQKFFWKQKKGKKKRILHLNILYTTWTIDKMVWQGRWLRACLKPEMPICFCKIPTMTCLPQPGAEPFRLYPRHV